MLARIANLWAEQCLFEHIIVPFEDSPNNTRLQVARVIQACQFPEILGCNIFFFFFKSRPGNAKLYVRNHFLHSVECICSTTIEQTHACHRYISIIIWFQCKKNAQGAISKVWCGRFQFLHWECNGTSDRQCQPFESNAQHWNNLRHGNLLFTLPLTILFTLIIVHVSASLRSFSLFTY